MKHVSTSLFSMVLLAIAILTTNTIWADYKLPNQPVGKDGYYIVKWDCEKDTWADSNDMEYDETFVLAIDLTGTAYENWVKSAQSQGGVTYPVDNTVVSLNTFRNDRGTEYTDNRARLWHIRDNIYGAMYNFAQFEMKGGGANTTPAIGEKTKIYTRIFESATLFSDMCYPNEPSDSHKKGSVWSYKDNWFAQTDNQPFFVFAPYTGTKTGAVFSTEEQTPGTHIFYDNNHYVVSKGYSAPCDIDDDQCCPFFYPLDPVEHTYRIGEKAALTLEEKSGNLTGVHYQWYAYKTSAGESTAVKCGTDSKVFYPGTGVNKSDSTYYCFVTATNCPDGVYSTKARVIIYQCTITDYAFTVAADKTGKYVEGDKVVITATYGGGNETRTFSWLKDGAPISSGGDYTITSDNNKKSTLTIQSVNDDLAGEYTCHLQEGEVADCDTAVSCTIELKYCPTYTIKVDGVVATSYTFYPGGWYEISCTSDAGAPTAMNLPAGVKASLQNVTTKGSTISGKLYIDTTAVTAPLSIEFPTKETTGYAACAGSLSGLISQCGEDEAYVIKWDSPEEYVVDDNGKVKMSNSPSNKNDQWLFLPTGEKVGGLDVVYLYNVGTGRYLYRGPVQWTKINGQTLSEGDDDYAEALTSTENPQTGEYKWILYYDQGRYIYIINVAGWDNANWNKSFCLHYRDYEYIYCQGGNNQMYDLHVCKPQMKVGKMNSQNGNPAMRTSIDPYNPNNSHLKSKTGTPVHFSTTMAWKGNAPAATIDMQQGEDTTFTAQRTDALHSINSKITYSSSDPKIASVDPVTGKVTAKASGTATITAKLENAGCFDGAELSYQVQVQGCTSFDWAIDGTAGITTLMYPGGWYLVSCTSDNGAPDVTISGTSITAESPQKSGKTTTVKVILQATASGDISLHAENMMGGQKCEDDQTITVSDCSETSAESRKIEWYNFNGSTPFPQYWIHGGASVFLRDNNGVLEADIEHQDGNDQWYIIKTGQKCIGQDVFYLQNVQTQRYVYRGTKHGNTGGAWEYTEALLTSTNPQTDDYKWFLYTNGNHTAIVNVSGVTSASVFKQDMYMLHVRNWEAPGLFSNPNIPSPRMVCGKMADQDASPAFYYKGYTTTKPVTQFQTKLNWKNTAPADTVITQPGNTFTYTAVRADLLHSINTVIKYESLDPTIATVNANTGAVTIVASDGETPIRAILEEVGCFKGDTLQYVVRLYDCTKDIMVHNDHLLPHQPKADDCSYIVKWDCATGTWAASNDMEWGETFVFAVNLAGTPLGEWVMKGSGKQGVERSVAFDRFQQRGEESKQFNLDASRLWHIRDTIFGATFNFSQIPFTNGQYYNPAKGEQTEISARLFGFETAVGAACYQPGVSVAGKWWEWSNVGTTQNQWPSPNSWMEDTYVSGNDKYLFRFAPYTGKKDPAVQASDDDSRDQWYDGHYFTRAGYKSPCPEDWPIDQSLSLDVATICDEKGETATLTISSSEIGYTYVLYKNQQAVSSSDQLGTGKALNWTIDAAGTYSIWAKSPIVGHDSWMGQCDATKEQKVSILCDAPTYLKFDDNNNTHVWSDVKNWWPDYNRLPNDTDSAVIAAPCQVDIVDAKALYITCTVNNGYDLTIQPTGGLTIVGEITNAKAGDILIQSTAAGTGSFVYKNPTTPYPAKVEFYCQAKDGGTEEPTWQYIGQPLSSPVTCSQQYTKPNTQIYSWDAQSDYSMGGLWYAVPASQTLAPFRGFCITQDQPATYVYEGTLNAAKAQTINIPYLVASDYPAFYLVSNSWTAPIRIADIETNSFVGVDATIYIMNTGTYQQALSQQGAQSVTGQAKQKGQYNAIPVHAAPYLSDALQVIPAMQGFFVHNNTADATTGTITLDYDQTVYNKTYTLSNESARTPVRRAAAMSDVESVHLTVENAYWADGVDLLQSEQFTQGFDQGWDGRKMQGRNVAINLSVETQDGEMSVAALNDWDNVPLILSCIKGLEYTFRVRTINAGNWYLYDSQNDEYTLLTDGSEYTFRASHSMEDKRFFIRKGRTTAQQTTTNDPDGKYIIRGHLVIVRSGAWYNVLGGKLK